MNWIDIRIRKPTEADGDENGRVLQRLSCGECGVWQWDNLTHTAAWMPIPPFNHLEIPEGWRVVDTATEKKTDKMKFWGRGTKNWLMTCDGDYTKDFLYITPTPPTSPTGYQMVKPPITPEQSRQAMVWYEDHWRGAVLSHDLNAPFICLPIEPQWRPFANAEEFKPFRERWYRPKSCGDIRKPYRITDNAVDSYVWSAALDEFEFEDGTPFGMKVE